MAQRPGSRSAFLAAAAMVCMVAPSAAWAVDTEYRDYEILINGKESGRSRLTLVQQEDGSTYMKATVDVRFRLTLREYTFRSDVQEWWKDGRLIGLKAISEENGKMTEVQGSGDGKQFRVNGRALLSDIWTTSYWKLADARFHNKQVPILEVDTGKDMTGELKYVGETQVPVGMKLQKCYHFRVANIPVPIDLWFDEYHRLVRQEFVESGQRTIVQLSSVRR